MIRDPLIFRLRLREETFALKMIRMAQVREFFDSQQGDPPRWEYVTLNKIRELLEDPKETLQGADKESKETRVFLWAARVLLVGDERHRYWVNRLSQRGIRNLRPKLDDAFWYLRFALVTSYCPKLAGKIKNRKKLDKAETSEINAIVLPLIDIFTRAMAPVKKELRFPEENPVPCVYMITEDIFRGLSDDCQAHLRQSIPRKLITHPEFEELKADVTLKLPDEARKIISRIEDCATHDHLSAISIESKDGQLVVSIVNVRSQLLTMEGWKFLELIRNHGEPICLGDLDRKGNWEAEPIITFSNNRAGELHAVYTANDSTIRVVCQREKDNKNGTKYTPDKAAFVLDQDYLLCLYVAILQLKNNKIRFDELREKAVTKAAPNLKELFDPGLFEG